MNALEVAAVVTAFSAVVASLTGTVSLFVALRTGRKIDGMLVDRDASNVAAGEAKGKVAADSKAETLAEGQRQGREMVREEVKASGLQSTPGGPVPVADDRTAKAAEDSADALKRIATDAEAKSEKPR